MTKIELSPEISMVSVPWLFSVRVWNREKGWEKMGERRRKIRRRVREVDMDLNLLI